MRKGVQKICENTNIISTIDGVKTKQIGGGSGDGSIMGKTVEIKISHQGCSNTSFQHELGECPWKASFMIFIDISPKNIYMTIFKNFTEETYKGCGKCIPYFPNKSITWRKKSGAFKLDTTIAINEKNIENGYTCKIDENTPLQYIKEYIERRLVEE